MASRYGITFITISLVAICIAYTNGQGYSYISNAIVNDLYTSLKYDPNNAPERWAAEGVAIDKALAYIDTLQPSLFSAKDGIELIVGTTGGNTATYIRGLTERLGNPEISSDQIPSEIRIVYTLNYVSEFGADEYANFRNEIEVLKSMAEKHVKQPYVIVRNYRPVTSDRQLEEEDYPKRDTIKMGAENIEKQKKAIYDLHDKITVPDIEIIGSFTLGVFISNHNVKKIVDGVVGSGEQTVTKNNQLLLAIPISQIGIMSDEIWTHQARLKGRLVVISNDNPSGMDENGDWTIDKPYPVNYILSCVWHKKLVNSDNLLGRAMGIVLDITFKGKRLFEELQKHLPQLTTSEAILKEDVNRAIASKTGVIVFKLGRMWVV